MVWQACARLPRPKRRAVLLERVPVTQLFKFQGKSFSPYGLRYPFTTDMSRHVFTVHPRGACSGATILRKRYAYSDLRWAAPVVGCGLTGKTLIAGQRRTSVDRGRIQSRSRPLQTGVCTIDMKTTDGCIPAQNISIQPQP